MSSGYMIYMSGKPLNRHNGNLKTFFASGTRATIETLYKLQFVLRKQTRSSKAESFPFVHYTLLSLSSVIVCDGISEGLFPDVAVDWSWIGPN